LMQVHVLLMLLTLKSTRLNQSGAQMVAAVEIATLILVNLAQQWVLGHESVVPVAVAVHTVVNAVGTLTLFGGIEVATCWRVRRSLVRN
jgi:hypothetical protein